MGNCCLPIRFHRTPSAVNPKNVTLLLLGLDNSGKTTIVKRLTGEPIDSVVPTIGFSVVLLRPKGCHVSVYDLGGGPQIRDIWPRYYADAHGIIFVIDSHDVEKMETCRKVLEKLLQHDQVSGKPILLLANKQDLDGALDEIDIVDRLNLEKIVNEQKCPTLVELCSALNFSKKIDIGIENGYKWLIRTIIREYPSLNNRVLRDLAKQEEENRVEAIRRVKREKESYEGIFSYVDGNPFEPVQKFLDEKPHANGYPRRKSRSGIRTVAIIPGLIEEVPQKPAERKRQAHHFFDEEIVSVPKPSAKSAAKSYSSEFFIVEKFQSDLELLNDVPNHSFKNFLVRPKSSGARLYGVRSEKKRKTHRRKPLRKSNKTGPSPFTDISNSKNGQKRRIVASDKMSSEEGETGNGNVPNLPNKRSIENVSPFVLSNRMRERRKEENYEMKVVDGSKSVPSSRRNSVGLAKNRRHSMVNSKATGLERFYVSSSLSSTKEILLDVTKLKTKS